jgi:hypothetical protein
VAGGNAWASPCSIASYSLSALVSPPVYENGGRNWEGAAQGLAANADHMMSASYDLVRNSRIAAPAVGGRKETRRRFRVEITFPGRSIQAHSLPDTGKTMASSGEGSLGERKRSSKLGGLVEEAVAAAVEDPLADTH